MITTYKYQFNAPYALHDMRINKIENTDNSLKIYFENGVPEKDINRVMQSAASAFSLDHPELFWISHNRLSFVYTVTYGAVYSITAEKKEDEESYYALPYTSKDEIEEDERLVHSKMDDILKSTEKCRSVFEKILLFHDTLCKMNVYNSYVKNGEKEKADAIAEKVKGKKGRVTKVEKEEKKPVEVKEEKIDMAQAMNQEAADKE